MLQLLGLLRCSSCRGVATESRCPTCGGSLPLDPIADPDGPVQGLSALYCSACKRETDLLGVVLSERVTDFWFDGVAAERAQVHFSDGQLAPRKVILRHKTAEVLRLLYFLRLGIADEPPQATAPHGVYCVDTTAGSCVLVAQAHREGDGTYSSTATDWFLVEYDETFEQQLLTREKPSTLRPRKPPGTATQDEGAIQSAIAYRMLYALENALRDFIRTRLSKKYHHMHGEKWWEAVIPLDVREQVAITRTRRHAGGWFEIPEEDPIYLTTFAQLRAIIEQRWQDLSEGLGPKEILLGALRKAEFFRNLVAHNRPVPVVMLQELSRVNRELTRLVDRRALDE